MPHYLVISTESTWAYSVELNAGQTYRIGRADDNDLTLKDPRISSYHGRLTIEPEGPVLVDLESRNGIELNGQRVRRVKLAHRDKFRLGNTELLYVTRLDPVTIGSQAYLSPKLSEPLMRTEVQKIASVVRDLGALRDEFSSKAESANGSKGLLMNASMQLDVAIDRLRDIENHARILVATNHFHEIFHRGSELQRTLQEALRFVASAVEAENAALMFRTGRRWTVEANFGLAVSGWRTEIPSSFRSLFDMLDTSLPWMMVPSLGEYAAATGMKDSDLLEGDRRAVQVVGIPSSDGRIAGAAYFDNITRPSRLREENIGLVTSCLAILARYVLNTDDVTGTRRIELQSPMPALEVVHPRNESDEESSDNLTQF